MSSPNYCPDNLGELRKTVNEELTRMQERSDLLASLFRHTRLSLPE
jgi:hypothetical protein